MALAIVRFFTGAKFKIPNRKMSRNRVGYFLAQRDRSATDHAAGPYCESKIVTHFFGQRGSSGGFVTIGNLSALLILTFLTAEPRGSRHENVGEKI
jgi:hypothetical protein